MTGRLALVVSGATGRVGRRLIELASAADDLEVVAALASADALDVDGDCLIDFSVPAGTARRLDEARERRMAAVIGTTGLGPEVEAAIDRAAAEIPVLVAANTSIGVHLLLALVAEAAARLGPDFDVEIVESHHRHKRDAPSGTALELLRAVCRPLGLDPAGDAVDGRKGEVGPRPPGQVGVHAVRGGDIVGEHTVLFAGDGERLELTHRATSRDTFARGALRAARFVAGRRPGRYAMGDVLRPDGDP